MAKQPGKIPGMTTATPEPQRLPTVFKRTELHPILAALNTGTVTNEETGETSKIGELMVMLPGEMFVISIGPDVLEQFRNELNAKIEVTSIMPPTLAGV